MGIKFEKVEYYYGLNTPFEYYALKGIDLDITPGKITAIIGHTGSGKSTLIQHLNALLQPTKGRVKIDEFLISSSEKPSKLKKLRKKTGLVFQFPEYQLFEETIEKDICFGPLNFGVSLEKAKKLALEKLKMVGLDETYLNRSPFDLSGGQKRRVAIAGILAMEPDILVLDEPTAGLDPQGTKEIMNLFKEINKQGTTIVVVTHDMNHVLEYCDDIVVMKDGKIVLKDSVMNTFGNIQTLINLNIELPNITSLIDKLNKKGFNLSTRIRSEEQLAKELGGLLNG